MKIKKNVLKSHFAFKAFQRTSEGFKIWPVETSMEELKNIKAPMKNPLQN